MTFRDLATTSIGNLRRMKLRTSLTIAGVVIAVGTFVAMLSFGSGNQQYVSEQFESFGLLHTMQAYPVQQEKAADSTKPRAIDTKTIEQMSRLPGVRLVFPFDAFNANASCADSQAIIQMRALPLSVLQTKWFNHFDAGSAYDNDTAKEALVSWDFLERMGIKNADSAIGKTVIVTVRKAIIDSGIAQLFPPDRDYLTKRWKELRFDSLFDTAYIARLVRREMKDDSGLAHLFPPDRAYILKRWNELKFDSLFNTTYSTQLVHSELKYGMSKFMDGLLNHRAVISDTLIIRGVVAGDGPGKRTATELMVPEAIARKFSGGIPLDDPTALMSMVASGNIVSLDNDPNAKSYSRVTLDIEPGASHKIIKDSIEAMGFRSFSYADEFEEISKFFLYFHLGLSVFGLIALVTAALGIINTLVMSILERRKEIGVMKSLGADERDIRNLFLTESGLIGFIGSVTGILLGWGVSRIASYIAKTYMASEGITPVELFKLPIWLIFAALALGTMVSVLAGLYPASRAARVDPVEALRSE